MNPLSAEPLSAEIAFIILGGVLLFFLIGGGVLLFWLAKHLLDKVEASIANGNTCPPVWQLPLGVPEGSVRGLISIFVVVFGLILLVLQKSLGMQIGEAITGFIGAIIAFYFTSRGESAARGAESKASAAFDAAKDAQTSAESAAEAATAAKETALETRTEISLIGARATASSASEAVPETPALGKLREAQAALQELHQTLALATGLQVGTGPVAGAQEMLDRVDAMLSVIAPLLTGKPDPAEIGNVAEEAGRLLRELAPREPVVSSLASALFTLGAVAQSSGTVFGALQPLAGPFGLVAAVVLGGLALVREKEKFDRWKAALLDRPMDLGLLAPDLGDENLAIVILEYAPLFRAQLLIESDQSVNPTLAIEVLRLLGTMSGAADKPVAVLAEGIWQDDPKLSNLPKGFAQQHFETKEALIEAIEEYRAAVVSVMALRHLPERVPGQPDGIRKGVRTQDLLAAVHEVRRDPRGAAEIDLLVFLTEALGKDLAAIESITRLVSAKLIEARKLAAENEDKIRQMNEEAERAPVP